MKKNTALLHCYRALTLPLLACAMLSSQLNANVHNNPKCNPVSIETCALPYPSDHYTRQDSSSATGLRLDINSSMLRPELIQQFDAATFSLETLNNDTGFSAAAPVVFELDQAPSKATLPFNGGNSVIAINLNTGEKINIRAKVVDWSANKLKRGAENTRNIVEIIPLVRWDYGQQYLVALTSQLKTTDNQNFSTPNALKNALQGKGAAASLYAKSSNWLQSQGYELNDILAATVFTVRDRDNITGKMVKLVDETYANDHPVRDVWQHHHLFGPIAVHVYGKVRIDNYRQFNTGLVDFNKTPSEQWVDFRLAIPRQAESSYYKAPIAIYGHGIIISKEWASREFLNAKEGIATFGIDYPNHGSRIFADGGYFVTSIRPDKIATVMGMPVQATIDYSGVLKALRTSLKDTDALPKSFWSSYFSFFSKPLNGNGSPDLDTSRIFVQGLSLGGVFGQPFASIGEDLKGAYLESGGAGISGIISDSIFWELLFDNIIPRGSNGAEGILLRAAAQNIFDYADGVNYLDLARNPQYGRTARPIVLTAGKGDSMVPNNSIILAANLLEAPIVGTKYFDIQGVGQQTDFDNGYGILQQDLPFVEPNIKDLNAHVLTPFTPLNVKAHARWIEKYIKP